MIQKWLSAVVLLGVLWIITSFSSGEVFSFDVKEGSIINLYDAFGKNEALTRDWGFSCITRYKGKTILFDAGSNADIFKHNVSQLGVDLSKIDIVVVSHNHYDHFTGLDYLLRVNPKVKIYLPFDIFIGAPANFDATGQEETIKDSLPAHMRYFGGGNTRFTVNQTGRFWNADVEYMRNSKEIMPGLTIVATRSGYMGYFSCYPGKSFVEGQKHTEEDTCSRIGLPELSLSMKSPKGEVLLVGCSHTGVENIIADAKKVTGGNIDLVYGGFHLLPFNRQQLNGLTGKLQNELKVRRVAPAHCTGHLAFKLLQQAYGENYLYAGLGESLVY